MEPLTIDALPVAVLDGHDLSDDALARLAAGSTSVVAFSTSDGAAGELAERWQRVAPATPLTAGGRVGDVREAIIECAKRRILVLATPTPADAERFVAFCLQGAAAATEFDIPGVAVHVMRDEPREGSVAWLTDTGELSGYGVLFAVAYAGLHGTGVDLIEPAGGTSRPRTPEAIEQALAQADAAGIPITRHTDPSPMSRVLRDPHCLVVHPVLDAPKGINLLHLGELPHKAVKDGNPAAVVELIEKFPGDVVAVYDGVLLIGAGVHAGKIAAATALGVIGIAGIGAVAAPAAMADSGHGQGAGHSISAQHIPAGNHYGWCKNPHNPHNTGESCGPMPQGWTGSMTQGPGTQGPVTTGGTTTVTVTGPDRTTPPQPQPQAPILQPTAVPPKTPIAVPPQPIVEPPLVPQAIPQPTQQTPNLVPPQPKPDEPGPMQVPQAIPQPTQQTPNLVPPQPKPDEPGPMQVPQAIPQPTQQTPNLVPPQPKPDEPGPMQVPQAIPQPTQQTPNLVPPQPKPDEPGPMQVPQAIPQPTQQTPNLVPPMLQPPLQATPNEVVTGSVPTVVASGVVTPDVPVDVGGSVVMPTTTTDVPAAQGITTETPSTVPTTVGTKTATPHQAGTSHPATHHASHPGHVTTAAVDGDHAPAGELAHTGGNAAVLAIVAGSLLAAGAGLAAASRLGKDEDPGDAVEG